MRGHISGIKRISIIITLTIAAFALVCLFAIIMVLHSGEKSIIGKTRGQFPDMSELPGIVQSGGRITYDGKTYEYDTHNINVLCMGIDSRGEETVGQADMIALIVFNTERNTIKCVCINRDSIGPVMVCDVAGNPITVQNLQVALAYSYGNSMEDGRKMEIAAISGLMCDVPINAGVSLDIDGIGEMNEIAGGVTLTSLEDIPKAGIKKNQKVTLSDEQAFYYVTERDSGSDTVGTNECRIERQKQYISNWCRKMKVKLKYNPFLAVRIYDSMSGYYDTDITKSQMIYLAKIFAESGTDGVEIYTLTGKYERENYYDRYVIDDEQKLKTMIDIFYKEVE